MSDPTIETDENPSSEETHKTAADVTSSGLTSANIFRHFDAHPIVLDLVLLRKYGVDWLGWESDAVARAIAQDFRSSLSHLNAAKLNAVKALHLVDTFWQRWEIFNICTMPFNNLYPDFDVMFVPTVAQCMVAVDTANRIRQDVPFSEEVKQWLCAVFFNDHIVYPIEPLDFLSLKLDDFPVQELQDLKEKWPAVRGGKAPMGETMEDIQLSRLKDVHDYLEQYRTRLNQQLSMVPNV